ncbi:MAG TPA: hypothetical protein VHU15_05310 [Stellaceae bacterium]|jgi:hypothetical protein|nr:hypothetical protein [Stellaceae bacterium]
MFDGSSYTARSLCPTKSELRSLEKARLDLCTRYQVQPTAGLARMIQQLEAEISFRKRPPKPPKQ